VATHRVGPKRARARADEDEVEAGIVAGQRETKPSASISRRNPSRRSANSAEATGSETFSETAEAVIRIDAVASPEMKPPFKFSARTRVGFSDTDAQGIVYYGRYFPYIDLARVEYHRNLGVLGIEVGEPGVEFVTRACTIEYEAPAVFDDELEVFIRVARVGRSSATYEAAVYRARDDVLMVTATQTLVLVDLDERKPCQIPASFRETIAAFEGDDVSL
jgi:acyl-CoA thioester hydrolase